jgi:PA14 domain
VPFQASYYNNMTLSGTPVLTRSDTTINFDWGTGSPDPKVTADNFSARWTRVAFFPEGLYNFTVTADDGVRLYIDGKLVIDKWKDQPATTYSTVVSLSATVQHTVTMEYYENHGFAVAKLKWEQLSQNGEFLGAYYSNSVLAGTPTLTRLDSAINFNWGTASPAPGDLPADSFSVRWTANTYLNTGQYRFTVTADDGVRLYLDGKLIIDKWKDQAATTYNSIKWITAGVHAIKMEYYEHSGLATAKLNWQLASSNGGYVGVYYDNQTLSGVPTQMRIDPAVNFAWGYGSPDPTIPADHFSARWIRNVSLNQGMYQFTVTVDDGVRLFFDGAPIIDHWVNQPTTTYSRNIWVTKGTHSITMEYYENTEVATAQFSFQLISS